MIQNQLHDNHYVTSLQNLTDLGAKGCKEMSNRTELLLSDDYWSNNSVLLNDGYGDVICLDDLDDDAELQAAILASQNETG